LKKKGLYLKTRKTGRAGKLRSHDEWIYGLNPVLEAIRSGRKVQTVVVASSRKDRCPEIEQEILRQQIKLQKVDLPFFESRFPKGHQGIAALAAPRKYAELDDLLASPSKKGEIPLFLVLDCLEDPRNFGAILRVADAGGVHGVIIQSHRSVTLGPEALKASAGASEYVPVAVVPNIKHAMKDMKEMGLKVAGAEAGKGVAIWDVDLTFPLALVIGSEGKGLRKTVGEDCDVLISLPMKGMVNSLNASVAAGAMIFEIMRQRMLKNLIY
jgi:23S rRNA (guanosine2251-2'-O)-methyltransferase